MATKNPYIVHKMCKGKDTVFINYNYEKLVKGSKFSAFIEQKIVDYLGLQKAGLLDDLNGCDGLDITSVSQCYGYHNSPKRIQIKTAIQSKSAIKTVYEYSEYSNKLYAITNVIKSYLKCFDTLVIYEDTVRGALFNPNNLIIIEDKQQQFEYLVKRAYITQHSTNDTHLTIQFNKTSQRFDEDSPKSLAKYIKANPNRLQYK